MLEYVDQDASGQREYPADRSDYEGQLGQKLSKPNKV